MQNSNKKLADYWMVLIGFLISLIMTGIIYCLLVPSYETLLVKVFAATVLLFISSIWSFLALDAFNS